jgi:hypothetical protein
MDDQGRTRQVQGARADSELDPIAQGSSGRERWTFRVPSLPFRCRLPLGIARLGSYARV